MNPYPADTCPLRATNMVRGIRTMTPAGDWKMIARHQPSFTSNIREAPTIEAAREIFVDKLIHLQTYFWPALDGWRRQGKYINDPECWHLADFEGMIRWYRFFFGYALHDYDEMGERRVPAGQDVGDEGTDMWRVALESSPFWHWRPFWHFLTRPRSHPDGMLHRAEGSDILVWEWLFFSETQDPEMGDRFLWQWKTWVNECEAGTNRLERYVVVDEAGREWARLKMPMQEETWLERTMASSWVDLHYRQQG